MMHEAKFYVGELENLLLIKIQGSSTMDNVEPLRYFIKNMDIKNYDKILIDFEETNYLDSTSLGLIAHMAVNFMKIKKEKVLFINLNDELKNTFISFGFKNIANIINDKYMELENLKLYELPKSSKKIKPEDILLAHKQLFELNDSNKKIFKNVIELLEKEIKKAK